MTALRALGEDTSQPGGSGDDGPLWRALAAGARDARDALFSHHAAFARQIAGRHFRRARAGELELQELRQLAYAGLLEAIDRYDAGRGVPFRAYAARRITGSVLDGVSHASELREQVTFRNRLRAERMRSLVGDEPEPASTDDAMRALAELATGLAIGFLLDSGLMASETTADRGPNAYDSLAWKETVRGLFQVLSELPERQRFIIRQHYLHGVAFELIADLLGLSKGRISQIHKQAIGELRRRLLKQSNFVLER
jgi:RNA polymerase sigma factor for flagellar operon FliA